MGKKTEQAKKTEKTEQSEQIDVGLKPGAHPGAPGGMSQQALVDELIQTHGWSKKQVKAWRKDGKKGAAWDLSAWPAMIDSVVQGRLDREAEGTAPWQVAAAKADRALDNLEQPGALRASADVADSGLENLLDEIIAGRAAYEAEHPSLLVKIPGVKDYIFNGHMGAGPSASERWINCTGSLELSRKFLETLSPAQQEQFAEANIAARQGTTAHAAAEVEANVLLGRMDQADADDALRDLTLNPPAGEEYTEEMAQFIAEYTDLVKSYADERGADNILIESRVEATIPLTDGYEGEVYGIKGSADFIGLPAEESAPLPPRPRGKPAKGRPKARKPEPVLVVGDLKYGEGLDVTVASNPQVRLYALGALELLVDEEGNLTRDIETIRYYIVQPRLGGIKVWEESLDDLLDWRDDVLAPALTAALHGLDEGATLNPSEEACQWCPARGTCPALTQQRVDQAAELFDVILETEVAGEALDSEALDDERLGTLLSQITGLVDLYDDLKAEAQRRLHRGGQVPGFKLVSYTPPRRWKDGVLDVIDESAPLWKPPALVTPTQALKLLAENEEAHAAINEWIEVPDKRPVIAPEGDRRKTWEGNNPDEMFPDLD